MSRILLSQLWWRRLPAPFQPPTSPELGGVKGRRPRWCVSDSSALTRLIPPLSCRLNAPQRCLACGPLLETLSLECGETSRVEVGTGPHVFPRYQSVEAHTGPLQRDGWTLRIIPATPSHRGAHWASNGTDAGHAQWSWNFAPGMSSTRRGAHWASNGNLLRRVDSSRHTLGL
ncbi:hypothetical protein B0H14DRAFT_2593213 [Mycena olivaceomarginata]|nr:hypothetical protein B0H14DRAFT_2593213 [Mycena olivaceomarginata]